MEFTSLTHVRVMAMYVDFLLKMLKYRKGTNLSDFRGNFLHENPIKFTVWNRF